MATVWGNEPEFDQSSTPISQRAENQAIRNAEKHCMRERGTNWFVVASVLLLEAGTPDPIDRIDS